MIYKKSYTPQMGGIDKFIHIKYDLSPKSHQGNVMRAYAPNWNLNTAIAGIYNAAMEPHTWPTVLGEFCRVIDGKQVSLFFFDDNLALRNTISSDASNGLCIDSRLIIENAKYLHQYFSSYPTGQLIPFTEFEAAPFSLVNESQNQRKIHSALNLPAVTIPMLTFALPLLTGNSIAAALFIYRNADCGDFSLADQDIIRNLSPHFVRAMHIHKHLDALKKYNESLLETLQRTNIPIFILNAHLQVIFISREAELLLKKNPAIHMNTARYLQVFFNNEQHALMRLLNDFLTDGFHARYLENEGVGLAISHPDLTHPLRLCFLPIRKPDFTEPQSAFMAIFAYDPQQIRHVAPEYLKQAFKLTLTEIHITQLLMTGLGIAEIAEARTTTLESTRWQIKQLLQKTNTHSQAELIRLLVILSNNLHSDAQLLSYPPKNPANG